MAKKKGDLPLSMNWREVTAIWIAALFIGFAISYNDWGFGDQFLLGVGLVNLIIATVIAAFSLWIKLHLQKRAGRFELATVEFYYSWTNLIYTFFLTFITAGLFVFAAPGRPKVKTVSHLRPGYMEPHISPTKVGRIVAAGTIASLVLIVLAKIWMTLGGGLLAEYLFRTNFWIAIISLIPLPVEGLSLVYQAAPLTKTIHTAYPALAKLISTITPVFEGEWIFFGSRPLWFLLVTSTIALGILIRTALPALTSLLLSIIIGFIAVIFWLYYVEFNG